MGTDDLRDSLSLSEAILQEVAECEEVPPEELNPPLYDVIDPDAIDAIFQGDTGHVSFEHQGYFVTVSHSGDVSLEQTESG